MKTGAVMSGDSMTANHVEHGIVILLPEERAPLLASSQEENEWPREDHTNPFAQPERTGIVRVHQKKAKISPVPR